jgi:AraC-like DNA-binding protein
VVDRAEASATRHEVALVETQLVRVYDVSYRTPRRHFRPWGACELTHIVLPRRGGFVLERFGERNVIDPNTAALVAYGDECRVGYPDAGGDDCTCVVVPDDVLEEALGRVEGRLARFPPRDHLTVYVAIEKLKDAAADPLEGEESALLLLDSVARLFTNKTDLTTIHLRAAQRWRIEQVQALLASAPAVRWDLHSVARAVHCSPFHLARQFRAATGETISRYLLQLRVSLAVERLADGETNLSALALETGFANHSHFTARFRRLVGVTPSAARRALETSRAKTGNRVLLGA